MKKQVTILASALFLLMGCGSDDESKVGEPNQPSTENPFGGESYVPVTLDAATELGLVKSGNEFTFRFFKEICRQGNGENLFVSPLSASLALSMTANGAAGNTAVQMRGTLGFADYTQDEMNAFYKKLSESLPQADPATQIGIANSIWIREDFPVLSRFTDVNRACYGAEITNLAFDPSAVERINQWCADKTNNRIQEILSEIDGNSCLFLLNALYFKGIWKATFDKKDTHQNMFTKSDGTKIPVQMMSQTNQVNFVYTPVFSIIELPYGNGTFNMVILLPNPEVKREEAMAALTPENWEGWMSKWQSLDLEIGLPKFKIEYNNDDLRGVFESLGMIDAFSAIHADFSNLSEEHLFISLLKQKAFVEVSEEGTEAAAVTIVGMENSAIDPSRPSCFIADRPFIFAIYEKNTKAVLFMGEVNEPVFEE